MTADLIQLYANANIRIAKLERENAALREVLNHAADILEECETSGARQFRVLHRAAIDAARKEAQP